MASERSTVFISLRNRIRRACLLGCVSGAALLVLAVGPAAAATYPGGGSTFTGSAEGWTGETECASIVEAVPLLLCSGSAGYTAEAGDPAGSFEGTTEVTLNLLQQFNSEETAVSPSFTVGEGGAGALRLERQFAPEGLAQLAPTVDYTAYLVDRTNGIKQKAITETIEAASPFTAKAGAVSLTSGHIYAIEVVAKLGSTLAGLEGIQRLGSTAFRLDNVSVTGPGGEPPNGGPGPGSPGSKGGPGTGGRGGVSSARLESLLQSSLIGPAVLRGNRIFVKAKCPAKLRATCTLTLRGLLTRHKPATAGRKAKVKKAKTKRFVLKVKPAARKRVKTRSKLLFKESAKVGKSKATVYKRLKLVRK